MLCHEAATILEGTSLFCFHVFPHVCTESMCFPSQVCCLWRSSNGNSSSQPNNCSSCMSRWLDVSLEGFFFCYGKDITTWIIRFMFSHFLWCFQLFIAHLFLANWVLVFFASSKKAKIIVLIFIQFQKYRNCYSDLFTKIGGRRKSRKDERSTKEL